MMLGLKTIGGFNTFLRSLKAKMELLFLAAAIFPALAATLIYKVTGKDLFSKEKNDL